MQEEEIIGRISRDDFYKNLSLISSKLEQKIREHKFKKFNFRIDGDMIIIRGYK